jgi:hypothetical protein
LRVVIPGRTLGIIDDEGNNRRVNVATVVSNLIGLHYLRTIGVGVAITNDVLRDEGEARDVQTTVV